VDQFFTSIQGETTFADMLVSYTPQDKAISENAEKFMLEEKITDFCRLIAENVCKGTVTLNEDGKTVSLSISWKSPLTFDAKMQAIVTCRPITLSNVHEQNISPSTTWVAWDSISIEAITAFIAFSIEMKATNESLVHEFALKISLEGIPEDRLSRITGAVLQNRQGFIRLLMMILGMSGINGTDTGSFFIHDQLSGHYANGSATPNGVLEMLLTAISRDAKRIDRIEELVADLRKTEEGKKLLPESFEAIWNPIIEVKRGRNG